MIVTDFMLSPKQKAQKYWLGFLGKTMIECEKQFNWVKFNLEGNRLKGIGTLREEGKNFKFTILYSPFYEYRFDRIYVETKDLIKSLDTHMYDNDTLCLYHPINDLKGRQYIDLVDILPWISEWVYYYCQYLKYKVWLGPEHPHNFK